MVGKLLIYRLLYILFRKIIFYSYEYFVISFLGANFAPIKRTSKKRILHLIRSFIDDYLQGNEKLQKTCWQEECKACCILHKVLASD